MAEGTVLTLLLPAGNPEAMAIAELFQANLASVGLTLQIEQTDCASYVGIAFSDLPAAERPDVFPAFWSPDYNDAWNQLWPQLSCDAWQTGNLGHYCNAQVEALLDRARATGDLGMYQAALSEIQQIATRDDPAAIYIAQAQWLTVLRRKVGGFAPHPIAPEMIDFYAMYPR